MLSHKALHPNIVQQADGTTAPIGEGGFIPAERHKNLYAGAPIPRRTHYGVPAPRRSAAPEHLRLQRQGKAAGADCLVQASQASRASCRGGGESLLVVRLRL